MIIACPACGTRYAVPDSSIGPGGRQVRCAKCRASWHQDGPEPMPDDADGMAAAAVPAAMPPPPKVEDADRVADPASPQRDHAPSGAAQPTERSAFERAPLFRPRGNPLRVWTIAAVLFALVAGGAIVAVNYFGLPSWVPLSRPTFALGQPDLVLDFPGNRQDRRTLPDGSEFFGISGSITNTGRETRRVPDVLIVFYDARRRKVYSLQLNPPKSRLAPGEKVAINEAITDLPKAAKFADIGWSPE